MATTIFDKSVFKPYFDSDSANAAAWAANVLAKLVGTGQVAKYIKREDENGTQTSFEGLFEPTAIFFSYFVELARTFRDFKVNDFLANEYLNHEGQFTCSEETLVQLQYLITNGLRIRSQRGTIKMIEHSNDLSIPHGELLRLTCWDHDKFFKLGVARPQYNGWNVNNSSPLNRSNTGRYDLNIGWEYTEDVVELSSYPLINSSYVSKSTYRGRDCIHIESVPFGQTAGIGGTAVDKRITIDPRLNYEVTFQIAQDVSYKNISFGCRAFDAAGDEISLQNVVDDTYRNWFFQTRRLNQVGRFYMARGIIYNKDIGVITEEQAKLNIGFGTQLKSNNDVASILPYIVVDNDLSDDSDVGSDFFDSDSISFDLGESGRDENSDYWSDPSYDNEASVYIWNIKVTPCNTAYNRCYLNNKNFIDVYFDNKNGKYSNKQIDDIMRKYFIPYNTAFKNTHIGEISEVNPSDSYLLLEDGTYILLETEDRILLEQ